MILDFRAHEKALPFCSGINNAIEKESFNINELLVFRDGYTEDLKPFLLKCAYVYKPRFKKLHQWFLQRKRSVYIKNISHSINVCLPRSISGICRLLFRLVFVKNMSRLETIEDMHHYLPNGNVVKLLTCPKVNGIYPLPLYTYIFIGEGDYYISSVVANLGISPIEEVPIE